MERKWVKIGMYLYCFTIVGIFLICLGLMINSVYISLHNGLEYYQAIFGVNMGYLFIPIILSVPLLIAVQRGSDLEEEEEESNANEKAIERELSEFLSK